VSRRHSAWIETTYEQGEKEVLLPIRARVVLRGNGKTVQGEVWVLDEGAWKPYKRFPRSRLGFVPDSDEMNALAEAVADAMIEWVEDHDPEGLEKLLQTAPEVGAEVVA
jgi:hypothetical protein